MDTDDRILHPNRGLVATPATETSPSQGDISATQPRGTRAPMWEGIPVQFHLRAAELHDLRLSGAIVGHAVGVRVGEVYRLCFPVRGTQVELLGRAIHSSVSRVVPATGGEGLIMYRTGLEFVGMKESVAQILSAYIDELRQQEAGRRMANPTAEAPGGKTRPPERVTPHTKVPTRPSGGGNAVPGNPPVSVPLKWWVRSPRELTALVMLGCVLVFSLYLGGIHNRWIQVHAMVASVPDPIASEGGPRGNELPPLLAVTSALRQTLLTAAGLISLQQGPVTPDPNGPIAARILGSSIGSIQAGAAVDPSSLSPIVSPIFGVWVSVPPRLPAPVKSDSQPVLTDSAVRPAAPQMPTVASLPQEVTAQPVQPDLSLPPPGASPTAVLSVPVPQPRSTRPKADNLPTRQATATPSEGAQSPAAPLLPQDGVAPRKVANMRGLDLQGADLRGADLQGADLTGARLAWARLTGAKLQGATLRRADLTEADLWLADLRGADLRETDLSGAKFTQEGQAASRGESTVEAVAMAPTAGEARPQASTEILDPRREAAAPGKEEDSR